jgi:hypothetical protein
VLVDDLVGKLAAGCIDIFAPASPDIDHEILPVKEFLKGQGSILP